MAELSIRWRAGCCRWRWARRPSSPGGCSTPTRSMSSRSGFGEETDTLDAEGEVVATSDVRPTPAQVEAVLGRFTGEIEQVPPAYSALKVEGKRAYDLARAGAEVELKSRRVTVHSLAPPRTGGDRPRTVCPASSSETLALHQLAWSPVPGELAKSPSSPGSPRAPTSARSPATSPAPWNPSATSPCCGGSRPGRSPSNPRFRWTKWAELAKARQLEQALLPLTAGLDDIPALPVTPDQAGLLRQGRKLAGIAAKPGLHLATDESVPVALVELSEGELRVVRGFNI